MLKNTINKELILRILFFLLGMVCISFGVSLTIISNFGAGAWDALSVGLSNMFGLSVGKWVIIVAFILNIAAGILIKRIPRFSTLITSIITGAFIDIWLLLFKGINITTTLKSFLFFIIGIIIISFGVAVYVITDLPPGPIDYFMLIVKERFNLSIGVAKTICESIGLILGIIFKGPIGIGSIVIMFTIGPLIQMFSKFTDPILQQIIYKEKEI